MPARLRHQRLQVEQLEDRRLLAIDFEILKDINTEPNRYGAEISSKIVTIGDQAFFSAENRWTGQELWKSDGTEAGTTLVRDINPRGDGLAKHGDLLAVGSNVFFAATDEFGRELWTSDGTQEGTLMVKDLTPGEAGSAISKLRQAGSRVIFTVDRDQPWSSDDINELWSSDGTNEGTVRLRNLPGELLYHDAEVGDLALFVTRSDSGAFPTQLWATDGTSAGTVRLRAFKSIESFEKLGDTVVFLAERGSTIGLWRTDGTAEGTYELSAFHSDRTALFSSGHSDEVTLPDAILIHDLNNGRQRLWRTDGTEAGTYLLLDIELDMLIDDEFNPTFFYPSRGVGGGVHFFATRVPQAGLQLWRSDGTAGGTFQLTDLSAETVSIQTDRITSDDRLLFTVTTPSSTTRWRSDGTRAGTTPFDPLHNFHGTSARYELNGVTLFAANDGIHGYEIWATDGTEQGTFLVHNIHASGSGLASSWRPVRVGDNLLFRATDGSTVRVNSVTSWDLWKTDGTRQGTKLVKDIQSGNESTYFQDFYHVRDRVVFEAQQDLWSTDGTSEGTRLLRDLGSSSTDLFLVNNHHLLIDRGDLWKTNGTPGGTFIIRHEPFESFEPGFIAEGEDRVYLATNRHVWVSDGTSAGTREIGDLPGCDLGFRRRRMGVLAGNKVFFAANDCRTGDELWVATESSGSRLVKDLATGFDDFEPEGLTALGNKVIFTGRHDRFGPEVWASDGSANGTVLLRDIYPGSPGSLPEFELTVGDLLYFTARTAGSNRELWRTDGTRGGTSRIVLSQMMSPFLLTEFGRSLLVWAEDETGVTHLWSTDGTASGSDKLFSGRNPNPSYFVQVGEELLFWADDEIGVKHLWKTDGTAAGTIQIAQSNRVGYKEVVDDSGQIPVVYFTAEDAVSGAELWRTDGTTEGTRLVRDIGPGATSGAPHIISTIDGQVYFSAARNGHHTLWVSDGTRSGTKQVDFFGAIPQSPNELLKRGDTYLLTAVHPELGRELWSGREVADPVFWQNPENRFDIDGDNIVSPLDALAAITELTERRFSDPMTGALSTTVSPESFLDVDGDGYLGPVDALLVIGQLPSSSSSAVAFAPIQEDEESEERWGRLVDGVLSDVSLGSGS